jgi:hypothetical protein
MNYLDDVKLLRADSVTDPEQHFEAPRPRAAAKVSA